MHRATYLISVGLLAVGLGCGAPPAEEDDTHDDASEPPAAEATSLFGKPLYPMELSAERKAELETNLAEAQASYDADPDTAENIIWLGRRLGYLGRYQDAIDVFSKGIELHPESFKLYRHRGHRYISVRDFDRAVSDLAKAAELTEGVPDAVEEDGAPNAQGIPRSTSHSNIWYDLAFAYYLQGDFEKATSAWETCMEFSRVNDDMLVATADWQYMTYRRLGRDEDAAKVLEDIKEDMDVIENFSYRKRLLMYKGLVDPEELLDPGADDLDLATQGYGVANFYFVNGEVDKAREILDKVLEGTYWSAFGYIAAEADVKRMEAEGASN